MELQWHLDVSLSLAELSRQGMATMMKSLNPQYLLSRLVFLYVRQFLCVMCHTFLKYTILSLIQSVPTALIISHYQHKSPSCLNNGCHRTLWAHFSQRIVQFNTFPPPLSITNCELLRKLGQLNTSMLY